MKYKIVIYGKIDCADDDSVKLVDLFRLFDQIAKEMGVEL